MKILSRLALTSLAALALAGCGERADKTAPDSAATAPAAKPTTSLASILASDGQHGALAKVTANSGLGAVLEGVGPYTVLAPPDAVLRA